MYKCAKCSKEFPILFIYNSHFAKCNIEHPVSQILSYRKEQRELARKIDGYLVGGGDMASMEVVNGIKSKLSELDLRISKLEKRNKSVLPPPLTDYMIWIKSLKVTVDDRQESFLDVIGTMKKILLRSGLRTSGVFCKWYCGKDLKTMKLLVAKKVLGMNRVIISYKWEYIMKQDVMNIVDHFWDMFKMEFIEWSKEGDEDISGETYKKYYANVMLISENIISREIKDFIMDKVA